MTESPIFYFDPTSPYVWMAAERIQDLIPSADWRPIYTFGLFKMNGRTPWILTDERPARLAEIEQRAASYGLPAVRWPSGLPERRIDLIRAAVVATQEGLEIPFSLAVLREIFTQGGDPSRPDELRRIAADTGLDPGMVLERIGDQDIKDAVRATTEEAHARGAPGVPTFVVDGQVFWGDDHLDEAVAAANELTRTS